MMDEQNQQAAAETTNADAQKAQGVVGESSAAAAPASTSQPAADTTSKSSEPQGTGDAPNAAPAVAEQPATQPSAAPASTPAGTLPTGASSPGDDPLHVKVAGHLEAIYNLTKEAATTPVVQSAAVASEAKSHIGDILHKISNGMSVAEGELVQKLQKLFHLL
jgi:hypothetical protein